MSSRPPFDPELVPVLNELRAGRPPLTVEGLPSRRLEGNEAARGAAPDFTAGGRVVVEQLRVPGPPDSPDIGMVVLRPSSGDGLLPLLYNTHGGGFRSSR